MRIRTLAAALVAFRIGAGPAHADGRRTPALGGSSRLDAVEEVANLA